MNRFALAKGELVMMNRRVFLLSSTSAAALAACSPANTAFAPHTLGSESARALAGAKVLPRLEIAEFSANAKLVAALRAGVAAMKAIKDPRNVKSWTYWHYSHWMPKSNPPPDMAGVWDQCRHAASYFLPWHRGFLYYFEKTLREASRYPLLTLPYWDYYKNPKLPEIYTTPTLRDGTPNSLYWAKRKNSSIKLLKYTAFADTVATFPWGPGETYEDLLEKDPHNEVHDQVGGSMGSVPTAPADPIFWAHHCNVDRLWTAWVAAGGKRKMPPASTLWWKETFAYNLDGSWSAKVATMNDTRNLGYRYADVSLPVAPAGASLPARPPVVARGNENASGPIALTLQPVTIEIPLDDRFASGAPFDVVLDGLTLSELGKEGGFDYSVYANLPGVRTPVSQEQTFGIGAFGSFALSMPRMNGMNASSGSGTTLRLSANRALQEQMRVGTASRTSLLLSFIASGEPSGVSQNAVLASIERISVVSD
jgi:tyrosinase